MTPQHAPGLLRAAWAMSEDDLEDGVRALIRDLRLKAFHAWKKHAQKASKGFPDWVIAGPGGHIFRELKKMGEKPEPDQEAWLALLAFGGADAGVWYPIHLLDGTISRELTAIARTRR